MEGFSVKTYTRTDLPKQRSTNLELFRIITMLLIIVHHYVVTSALLDIGSPMLDNLMSKRSLFLLLLGAWGKTGINCFVLITGYFMCKSQITAKKFFKLYLQVLFYYFAVNSVLWITGYCTIDTEEFICALLPIGYIYDGFDSAYLLFFLCIPFLNVLLQHMTQRMHAYLLLLLFFLYVVPGTLRFMLYLQMNYVSWFIVLYFLGSYVRLYPSRIFENTKFWGICSLICIAVSAASVVVCTWLGVQRGDLQSYYFVADSNTFLAVATGLSSFLFFKNLKIPYIPIINKLASTCFGVLLLHSNSWALRAWLWDDFLNNTGVYQKSWMPLHALGSTLAIFLICAGIDLLRQKYLEEPFFRFWDKHWERISGTYREIERKLFQKLNIQEQ